MKIITWAKIVFWFKTHKSTENMGNGIVCVGWVKKDHFTCKGGMAELMATHGCKLLEEEP